MIRLKLQFLLLSTVIIISYSCHSNQTKQISIPVIETINKSSLLKLSDYAGSIEYISLETTDKILLTGDERIVIASDYFIVFGQECYVFNRKGDFVRMIGKAGRGPKEYSSARSGYFYPGDTLLFFKDPSRRGLISYSIKGSFIKNSMLNRNFFMIRSISDSLFAGYRAFIQGDSDWNTLIVNYNGDSVSCIPNKYHFEGTSNMYFNHEVVMYDFNGALHIKEMYSDTIYSFNDKGIHTPKFILELGILSIPQDIRNWDFERFRNSIGRDFFFVNEIFETDKYLILKYNHDNKRNNLMIFNKQTGEIDNFPENERSGGIRNDMDGGPNFIPEHNDNNIFLQKINAFELKALVATEEYKNSTSMFPEKKRELEELAASLNENDNPVLMLVKLKK
jgi:hypothetical protein